MVTKGQKTTWNSERNTVLRARDPQWALALNQGPPSHCPLTLFPDVPHDCWTVWAQTWLVTRQELPCIQRLGISQVLHSQGREIGLGPASLEAWWNLWPCGQLCNQHLLLMDQGNRWRAGKELREWEECCSELRRKSLRQSESSKTLLMEQWLTC